MTRPIDGWTRHHAFTCVSLGNKTIIKTSVIVGNSLFSRTFLIRILRTWITGITRKHHIL